MTRNIARAVCGPRIKWVVLAFWIAVTVVLGSFGAKLADVEDNETVNWLPGSAESTQALVKVTAFRSDTTLDAVIVYERDGGITADDVAAAQADMAEFEEMNGRTVGDVVGDDSIADADTEVTIDGEVQFIPPEASTDGAAMQVVVPIDAGKDGWLIMPDLADHMRGVAETDANGMTTHLAGYAGLAADQAEAFESIDGVLAARRARRGDHHLADHLPQPDPVDLPGDLRRLRPVQRAGRDLPAGEVRRPHGQRPDPQHPQRAGARRRHRLCAVTGRPVSRGAASPPRPARGDVGGVCTAPARRSSPAVPP